ncbi:hypothetical protein R3P38DRAFT_3606555 [Favolaschia claudopus]|uniref:Type III effector HopI1 n=1 Tax=Favolaschia claudopus TaxID=2862362 RepID=A0AAW0DFC4_9AGAR
MPVSRGLRKFLGRVWLLLPNIKRPQARSPTPSAAKDPQLPRSEGTVVSASETNAKESRPYIDAKSGRTAVNALHFSLEMLSEASSGTPLGALKAIINPLLRLTDRFGQTSSNAQNLAQLSERIKALAPVVKSSAETNSQNRQTFIERLGSDYVTKIARTPQFFNADDNTATIKKHNKALSELLLDFTKAGSTSWDLRAKPSEAPSRWKITGGFGGMGGASYYSGGEGGHAEGPQLNLEPVSDIQLPRNLSLTGMHKFLLAFLPAHGQQVEQGAKVGQVS